MTQLQLWPAGTPTPSEPGPELPESIRQLLEAGYPANAVWPLLKTYGGQRLSVPKSAPATDHPLFTTLGHMAAKVLVSHLGGCTWEVPRGLAALRAARDSALRADFDRGTSTNTLAARYGVTRRHVLTILGRL